MTSLLATIISAAEALTSMLPKNAALYHQQLAKDIIVRACRHLRERSGAVAYREVPEVVSRHVQRGPRITRQNLRFHAIGGSRDPHESSVRTDEVEDVGELQSTSTSDGRPDAFSARRPELPAGLGSALNVPFLA